MNKRTTKPSRIIVSGVALMLALLLILSIVFSAIRVFAQEGTSAAPVSETPSTSTTSSATDSTAKPIPSGKTESADSTSENKTEKPEPKPGELVKDEVIYSKLELDGSVRGVFVVNIFTSDKAERATDTGSYTNVQSLGGGTIDSWDGKQVTFSKEPGSFTIRAIWTKHHCRGRSSSATHLMVRRSQPINLPGAVVRWTFTSMLLRVMPRARRSLIII